MLDNLEITQLARGSNIPGEYLITCWVSLNNIHSHVLMTTHIKLLNSPLPVGLFVNSLSIGTSGWQLLHEGDEGSCVVVVVVGRHNK